MPASAGGWNLQPGEKDPTVKIIVGVVAVGAIALGVIWLGILIMSGRATVLSFLTFLIGVAICLAGGFW